MADTELSQPFDGVTGRQDVLQVLADPTCRAILQLAADQTRTAAEVAEALEVPLSTVYRKLDELVATPLVETTYRLRSDGHHSREFRCNFDRVRIELASCHDRALEIDVS